MMTSFCKSVFTTVFGIVLSFLGEVTAQELNYFDHLSFAHPEEILKLDPGVYQSLPGVYRVHTSGIFHLECPASVEVDFARLKADTAAVRSQFKLPNEISDDYIQWLQVAKEPDKYLKVSSEIVTLTSSESELGTGSCYAIDRRGILVTNRHVVASESKKAVDGGELMQYKPQPLMQLFASMIQNIGPWKGTGMEDEFMQSEILGWFAARSKQSTQVTGIQIAVAYSAKNLWEKKATLPTNASALADTLTAELFKVEVREPKLLPAHVVAMGEEGHLNDIAILQIDGNIADALICLNLAKPEMVREQTPVYTLGFPGYRYDFANLTSRDEMSVTLQGGEVIRTPKNRELNLRERLDVRLLEIQGAEDLLFVSARMSFGSSGGPVILTDGTVAGMTVCGTPHVKESDQAISVEESSTAIQQSAAKYLQRMYQHSRKQNLAVPLPKILAFLKKHGIDQDSGPTTQQWRNALASYRSGDYESAVDALTSLANRQVYFAKPTRPFELKTVNITSHYVSELLELAKTKAKAFK